MKKQDIEVPEGVTEWRLKALAAVESELATDTWAKAVKHQKDVLPTQAAVKRAQKEGFGALRKIMLPVFGMRELTSARWLRAWDSDTRDIVPKEKSLYQRYFVDDPDMSALQSKLDKLTKLGISAFKREPIDIEEGTQIINAVYSQLKSLDEAYTARAQKSGVGYGGNTSHPVQSETGAVPSVVSIRATK